MKTLKELISNIKVQKIENMDDDAKIEELFHSSAKKVNNGLFFCLNGKEKDGHDFAQEAINNGAVAIICERQLDINVTQIIVNNSRTAMSLVAKSFYDKKVDKLKIISIIGTNGKTTCAYMTKSILETANKQVGIITTNEIQYSSVNLKADMTTPDPIELHKIFFDMYNKNIEYVIMEVSAHAIALQKMAGIKSEVAIFTNCTEDHLDFFENMKKYEKTKMSYFDSKFCKACVINIDSLTGQKIQLQTNIKDCLTYGLDNPSNSFAINIATNLGSCTYTANIMDEVFNVKLSIGGEFNIYNSLAVLTACKYLKIENKYLLLGINNFKSVSGRYNIIKNNLGYKIILDFAHTPDAIEKMCQSVKPFVSNDLAVIFGATGGRDKQKRKLIGRVLDKYADRIYLTTDSPRYENPKDINNQVLEGIKNLNKVVTIFDRSICVVSCLMNSKKGDIVLVLGKGTEDYQEVCGTKFHYSDLETINDFLRGED